MTATLTSSNEFPSESVQFAFKGRRDYVQGPDIFNALVGIYPAASVRNVQLTTHGFIRNCQCDAYHAASQEALGGLAEVKARASFELSGSKRCIALRESRSTGPEQRLEYDEHLVTSLCRIHERSTILEGESPFTFIETVVSMNKYLHQTLFADAIGKWVFTGVTLSQGCDARNKISLTIGRDVNYRLTRAHIMFDMKNLGYIYFSLLK